MSHNAKWEAEQAKRLIGYTIIGTTLTPGTESFGLVIEKGGIKAVVVWVDSDEEGNDCGHLSIPRLPGEEEP